MAKRKTDNGMTQHVYPDDIEPGGSMLFCNHEVMKGCICLAADKLSDSDFRPSFSRLANVVVNSGDEDAEFTKACTAHLPRDAIDFYGFDMTLFAYSVMAIMELGWEAYLAKVREYRARPAEEDLFTLI